MRRSTFGKKLWRPVQQDPVETWANVLKVDHTVLLSRFGLNWTHSEDFCAKHWIVANFRSVGQQQYFYLSCLCIYICVFVSIFVCLCICVCCAKHWIVANFRSVGQQQQFWVAADLMLSSCNSISPPSSKASSSIVIFQCRSKHHA